MSKPQRYFTRIDKEDLNVKVVKIGELFYRATGEFRGVMIEEEAQTEIAAFGKWYKAAELEAKSK